MMRRATLIRLAALVLVATAVFAFVPGAWRSPRPAPPLAALRVDQLEVEVMDRGPTGRERHLSEFRGTPFVATMVYTRCTSVCPRVTADLQRVERALPPAVRARARFLLFSLDPEHDTPEALAGFAQRHGLDPERWTMLATRPEDLRTLAAVLEVRFRPDTGGEIAHSATFVVVDGAGVVRRRQQGVTEDVGELVAAVTDATR